MSGDDLNDWTTGLKGGRLTLLEQIHPLEGFEDPSASRYNVSMNAEMLGVVKNARKRLSSVSKAVSEDDSAMEMSVGRNKNEIIVNEYKSTENYEESSIKINNEDPRKTVPTWDFMEGCSYDVQNYRINGELSYLKDIQPSRQLNNKTGYKIKNLPQFHDLSNAKGDDDYFLPLSQYCTDLKLSGPRITDSVLDMQTSIKNQWTDSYDVSASHEHIGGPIIRDSVESQFNDAINTTENEVLFGRSINSGGISFLDNVRNSMEEGKCEDPSLSSSSVEESSIDDSCGEYSMSGEEDDEEDDDGAVARALRFIVGMGAFAALHLMK
eukprot:g8151.t1